jgi:hypothetical protein
MSKVALTLLAIGLFMTFYRIFFDKKAESKLKVTPIKKKELSKIWQPVDYTEGLDVVMESNQQQQGLPVTSESFNK